MSDRDEAPWWAWLVVLVICLPFTIWGCPRPKQARAVLEAEGYTSIHVKPGGGEGLSCGDDGSATGFTARHHGMHVKGVVCCGLVLKACTVRVLKSEHDGKEATQ
jgi:hypothetical protein